MNHPDLRVGTHPADHVEDGLVIGHEIAAEDRLVMRDAVAQIAETRQGAVNGGAWAPGVWKGAVQGRTPERHFVVTRPAGSAAEEPLPKAERQFGDDASRIERPG